MSGAHSDSERPREAAADARPRVVDAAADPERGPTARGRFRPGRPLIAAAVVAALVVLLIALTS